MIIKNKTILNYINHNFYLSPNYSFKLFSSSNRLEKQKYSNKRLNLNNSIIMVLNLRGYSASRNVKMNSKITAHSLLESPKQGIALKEPQVKYLREPDPYNLFLPRIIVVTSGKGGVGKTTCTANIGLGIAMAGFRVLMVDCDLGLKNLDILLGVENRVPFSALDFFQGRCNLSQALIRSNQTKNASFLALTKTKQQCHFSLDHMARVMRLLNFLEFHYVFVDCPAGIDAGFLNAITPATESIVVTTPDITAIRDADRVAGILDTSHINNNKLLVNRVDSTMVEANTIMDVPEVQEILGLTLLGAIPSDPQIIVSTNQGRPLILDGDNTPSGAAFGKIIHKLINEKIYRLPYNIALD